MLARVALFLSILNVRGSTSARFCMQRGLFCMQTLAPGLQGSLLVMWSLGFQISSRTRQSLRMISFPTPWHPIRKENTRRGGGPWRLDQCQIFAFGLSASANLQVSSIFESMQGLKGRLWAFECPQKLGIRGTICDGPTDVVWASKGRTVPPDTRRVRRAVERRPVPSFRFRV